MYVQKNELIHRLCSITGKHRSEFALLTVKELSQMYESLTSTSERKYINVPYKEKDIAKLLGARYDGDTKKWYIPEGVDEKNFKQWMK